MHGAVRVLTTSLLFAMALTRMSPALRSGSISLAFAISLAKPYLAGRLSASTAGLFCSPINTKNRLLSISPQRRSSVRMTVSTATSESAPTEAESISGPSWVLEYESTGALALLEDVSKAKSLMVEISTDADSIKHLVPVAANLTAQQSKETSLIPTLLSMNRNYWDAVTLLRNVATFASCTSSVDGTDDKAKKLSSQIQVMFSQCKASYEPASLILNLCPEDIFDEFVSSNEHTRASEYILRHSRKMKDHKLSLQEENMVTRLSVTGHSAWGSMYTDLSSVLPVKLELDGETKTVGIATAEAMRDSPNESERKASWEGIREAWLPHQETCAAALNAITGWRLDMYKERGFDSYLAESLHMNRMSRGALDSLFAAIDDKSELGRRVLRIQAKALGKDCLEPWDLFAPAPVRADVGRTYTFDEGIDLIANAVSEVDKDAGDFVKMMKENFWIEASRGNKKRPGA